MSQVDCFTLFFYTIDIRIDSHLPTAPSCYFPFPQGFVRVVVGLKILEKLQNLAQRPKIIDRQWENLQNSALNDNNCNNNNNKKTESKGINEKFAE